MLSFIKTQWANPKKTYGQTEGGTTLKDPSGWGQGYTISLQQVTGGNTPNLVLKRMLGYFLKIPPLKYILQF